MNIIYVHKKNILNNLNYLQGFQPNSVMFPVLKSNAYGHGILQMLKILSKVETPYVIVDSYPEYQIVKNNSKKNMLLIGETLPENYSKFDFSRVTFAVYNVSTLHALGKTKKNVRIHVFLNTGMNREGVDSSDIDSFLDVCRQYSNIELEGVMSHLYNADFVENTDEIEQMISGEGDSIEKQIDLFKQMHQRILDYGFSPVWRHIGNSSGIFKIKDSFFNAWRPGLAMYGYTSLDQSDSYYKMSKKLEPSLSIVSRVISSHTVWPGDGVSYGHTYVFDDREMIATVPFGYSEGLPRSVSNDICFKFKKKYFKQVGTICMNLCSFLSSDDIKVGDKIELISNQKNHKNTIEALSKSSNMIVYELLVGLDKGIRREII